MLHKTGQRTWVVCLILEFSLVHSSIENRVLHSFGSTRPAQFPVVTVEVPDEVCVLDTVLVPDELPVCDADVVAVLLPVDECDTLTVDVALVDPELVPVCDTVVDADVDTELEAVNVWLVVPVFETDELAETEADVDADEEAEEVAELLPLVVWHV